MKATTRTITKTIIETTGKEYSHLNAVTWIFSELSYGEDTELKNLIKTEWKNQGLNFGVEEVTTALNTLCNLVGIINDADE